LKEQTHHPAAGVLGLAGDHDPRSLVRFRMSRKQKTALPFFCSAAFSDGKPDPTKDRATLKSGARIFLKSLEAWLG
jgi:hypothetical protein